MGLNAYVAPVSAILAGDYVSLTIKLGGETLVRRRDYNAPGMIPVTPAKRYLRRIMPDEPRELDARRLRVQQVRQKAAAAAAALMKEVAKASGTGDTSWNEEGGVVYEHPLYRECLAALRDYAKNLDGYFPHLCDHSLKGFYVPVTFNRPVTTEENVLSRKVVDIGSSTALREELLAVNRSLGVDRRWDDLRDGEGLGTDDPVKVGFAILESLARRSVESITPICFDE